MIWLLLLGILTYIIVRQSVKGITRTPVWLLWFVMMTPAFIWAGWVILRGGNDPIPLALLLGPFIVCPIVYWILVQWGRTLPSSSSSSAHLNPASTPPPSALPTEPDMTAKPTQPMTKEEEADLQNCFPWSVFYLQNIERRPQALICRGQLRTSPDVAYKTVRENVEAHFNNRFLVVFQEGLNGKPFFALVPNIYAKMTAKGDRRPVLALGLFLATLLTMVLAGVTIGEPGAAEVATAVAPEVARWEQLQQGLPYGLALMAIVGIHELGHFLMAQRYRIRTTLPYFIPVPPIPVFPFGTFGAFVQFRSPLPSRRALFDIGIAGPLAGFVVTLPLLLWGLAHSTVVALTPTPDDTPPPGLFNFSQFTPTASLLLTLLSKLALGNQFTAGSALDLHPVAIAGCLGVVITALNLMPVGQLDGGHIVHAMFGQRNGAIIGQISRFLVLALCLVQRDFLIWAILLFFMPSVDEPALNDVSELDNKRDLLGLLALGLLVIILLPMPPTLTDWLL